MGEREDWVVQSANLSFWEPRMASESLWGEKTGRKMRMEMGLVYKYVEDIRKTDRVLLYKCNKNKQRIYTKYKNKE